MKQHAYHSPSYNNRSDDCCIGSNAGIDTTGSFMGETPTVSEQSYLYQVCSQTSSTIHNQNHVSSTTTAPSSTTTTIAIPIVVSTTSRAPSSHPTPHYWTIPKNSSPKSARKKISVHHSHHHHRYHPRNPVRESTIADSS